jgi:hypothetical protein
MSPRDEWQYAAQLRKHVLATSDPDITEAQMKEKIEGINHAAELYEISPAEQACSESARPRMVNC